jgi:mono/diheme cytochrome c family protein
MDPGTPSNFPCKPLFWAGFVILVAALALGAFNVYGGYNVAADDPHSAPVLWLANTTRIQSIAAHSKGIVLPDNFGTDDQVKAGASLYGEMCVSCHLGPGVERSEISQGLYPRAPEMAKGSSLTPEEEFWVIKHGIKMTGMAAWGQTHSDDLIWKMVAFLRKLPSLTPAQYKMLTADAAEDHDSAMKNMPGMKH